MKLLIQSQTSMVAPLKLEKEYVISSRTLTWIYLLTHAGIKDKPYL